MQANVTGLKAVLLGAAMVAGMAGSAPEALAKSHAAQGRAPVMRTSAAGGHRFAAADYQMSGKHGRVGGHGRKSAWARSATFAATSEVADAGVSYGGSSYGGMSCVPFARANSGIELAGNAWAWWNNAAGVYERGARPEVGSVLNFRANGHMRSGHVAVVTNVEDARTVDIDHANWSGRGAITRNVTVVDVSPANDWSAVRVALGRSGGFGSVYPTYGFIYDRPDHGVMVANTATAPMPMLANAAPRDLRPAVEQFDTATGDEPVEVADATPRMSYRHSYRVAFRPTFRGDDRHGLVHRVKATASLPVVTHHAGHKRVRG